MFDSLSDRFTGIFSSLRGKGRLSEADVDKALREVRLALLEADVNVSVAKNLLARIKERALGAAVHASLTPGQQVIKIVHEELITTLGTSEVGLKFTGKEPFTILMVGLQGSGKTTTSGKLAKYLRGAREKPITGRGLTSPARQPSTNWKRSGRASASACIRSESPSRGKVVKAAMKEAVRAGHDVVIVDTAGRLAVDKALMDELADIRKISNPDEVLLVVDAMTGQDAVNVAQGFLEYTDLTGFILSKLDGDSRGWSCHLGAGGHRPTPSSLRRSGESLNDFEVFYPERMASRILGMGDVLTLIEKGRGDLGPSKRLKQMAEKLRKAEFDLEDFLAQFQQIRRMGPLQGIACYASRRQRGPTRCRNIRQGLGPG